MDCNVDDILTMDWVDNVGPNLADIVGTGTQASCNFFDVRQLPQD